MAKTAKYFDMEKHLREEHGGSGQWLREFILGWQDGLVNVLGIILGVAAATNDARIVVIAGLAATFAESVSMAAVAYTSTKAQRDYYFSQLEKEKQWIRDRPADEKAEVYEVYYRKGFRGKLLDQIVRKITSNKKTWLDFMMMEELGLEKVAENKPLRDGVLVGVSAVVGSLIPLVPFFFLAVQPAMMGAVGISLASLFAVGAYKAKKTVGSPFREGVELMVVGGLAAAVGYGVGAVLGVVLP
ncbi:MAG: VIT1/CCC1 transporter family protein [Candidatus Micrarchaeota archaeon]|nr:VIT1/CCC1 transporter family protein [Candidatus Micrarchaeota archaeon]